MLRRISRQRAARPEAVRRVRARHRSRVGCAAPARATRWRPGAPPRCGRAPLAPRTGWRRTACGSMPRRVRRRSRCCAATGTAHDAATGRTARQLPPRRPPPGRRLRSTRARLQRRAPSGSPRAPEPTRLTATTSRMPTARARRHEQRWTCDHPRVSQRDLAHVLRSLWDRSGGKADVPVAIADIDDDIGRGRGDMRTPLNLGALRGTGPGGVAHRRCVGAHITGCCQDR